MSYLCKQGTYQYRSLENSTQEIRLLQLSGRNSIHENPNTTSTTLMECRLIHTKLDDKPNYIALSYTWGDPSKTTSIILEGHTVQVTKNLHQALFHFQQEDTSLMLWVDALCINQSDFDEKSAQVKLMTEIYTCASRVHIWLGPTSHNSTLVLTQMQSLGSLLITFTKIPGSEDSKNITPPNDNELKAAMKEAVLFAQTIDYEALYALMDRPWWRRVWVIQEAILAQDAYIFCGVDSVSWVTFFRTVPAFISIAINPVLLGRAATEEVKLRTLVMRLMRWQTMMAVYGGTDGKGLSLIETILNCCGPETQATDPRDGIYGLLGMVRKEDREKITAAYSADVTLAKVLFLTMKVLLEEYGPDLFCHIMPNSLSGFLPSWVANWTAPSVRKIGGYERSRCHFSAGKCRKWDGSGVSTATFEAPAIKVPALMISMVDKVGPSLVSPAEDPKDISQCRTWLEEIEHLLESVHSDLDNEVDFQFQLANLWRLPIADQNMLERADQNSACLRGYHTIRGDMLPSGEIQGDLQDWVLRESWIYRRSWKVLSRLPFVTADGKLGLGPGTLCADDRICIMAGGSVPFVIRDIGNDRYCLIGEAYVHGIMDGEACQDQALFPFIHII